MKLKNFIQLLLLVILAGSMVWAGYETGSAYQTLRVPSGGGRPQYGALAINQSAAVTGTLGHANGGTDATTLAAAFQGLYETVATTAGDILQGGASGTPTRTAIGTAGQVWTVNSGATAGAWAAAVVTPSGALMQFAGTSCPTGYVAADGTSYSTTGATAALYAAIGTTWGNVDGSHFNVPDMRGQFARGATTGMGNVLITSITSNVATVTAHGFNHSGVPVQITGTPPTGLSTGTTYYVIYVSANTISFATTEANALAGTAISISTANGTVVQWQDPDASTRFAEAIGAATSGVGSCQLDQFASHTHGFTVYNGGGGASTSPIDGATSSEGTDTTSATGGNETRGKNAYVLYCIKE